MAKPTDKAIERWREHCQIVDESTYISAYEPEAQRRARIERAREEYAYFVEYYFPHYTTDKDTGKHIACGKFHINAANKIRKHAKLRAAFKWARGHAKSTNLNIFIPLWLKIQEPKQLNVMVLIGKSEDNAKELLSDIQAEFLHNKRYINDFGTQVAHGSWEIGRFTTADGTAFYAKGRGQSPRGLRKRQNRPDYIVVDDIDDDELIQNEKRVRKLTDWIFEALLGTFDMGRGRFVIVGNLISKNSVMANVSKRIEKLRKQRKLAGKRYDNYVDETVNAIDEKGKVSWPEKYTLDEIRELADFLGERSAQKELFNNPIVDGTVFKQSWIGWKKLPKLHEYTDLVVYCDPSFKNSSKSDYKAVKFWGKYKTELHLIKAFVRQSSIAAMVKWMYDLYESMPDNVIVRFYMEVVFLQDLIMDDFFEEGLQRNYQLPIRGDKRQKPDKFARIEATSPLYERGMIFYNEDLRSDPDMERSVEQLLNMEKGSNFPDDSPDADEGAFYILQKKARTDSAGGASSGKRTHKNKW